jgi:hypothetical protein
MQRIRSRRRFSARPSARVAVVYEQQTAFISRRNESRHNIHSAANKKVYITNEEHSRKHPKFRIQRMQPAHDQRFATNSALSQVCCERQTVKEKQKQRATCHVVSEMFCDCFTDENDDAFRVDDQQEAVKCLLKK